MICLVVGFAPEYVHPQKELEEELQQRIKMAELQLEYRVSCKLVYECHSLLSIFIFQKQNIENKYQEEVASAHKNFEVINNSVPHSGMFMLPGCQPYTTRRFVL